MGSHGGQAFLRHAARLEDAREIAALPEPGDAAENKALAIALARLPMDVL